MFDIITVGSATVDVFAKTHTSELIKIVTPTGETDLLAYPAGTKILIDKLNFTTGGCGTNTAVAFSRLGLKTAFLGKLGDDENADIVRNKLKKENVADLSVTGKEITGYAMVLDSIEHDRTILIYRGANNNLKWADVKKNKLKTKWFYFSTMMETSFKTIEQLSAYAAKNSIKIALNTSQYLARKGPLFLKKILRNTEILILNENEAQLLSGKDKIANMIPALHSYGPRIVAITSGKKGVVTCNGEEQCKVHPLDIKIVETTGAGDAFAAAFVGAIIKGKGMDLAVKLGQANAESVIQHHGAKEKLLNWDEAVQQVRKNNYHVEKTTANRKS